MKYEHTVGFGIEFRRRRGSIRFYNKWRMVFNRLVTIFILFLQNICFFSFHFQCSMFCLSNYLSVYLSDSLSVLLVYDYILFNVYCLYNFYLNNFVFCIYLRSKLFSYKIFSCRVNIYFILQVFIFYFLIYLYSMRLHIINIVYINVVIYITKY